MATHIVQVREVDLDRCRQETRIGLHRYRDDLRVEQRAVAERERDDRSIRITQEFFFKMQAEALKSEDLYL